MKIEIDSATYEKLQFASSLTGQSVSEVVRNLVERMSGSARGGGTQSYASAQSGSREQSVVTRGPSQGEEWLPVFKVFKNHRIKGKFNPQTFELKIETDPWNGKAFTSPTAAAVAVVEHFPSSRVTSNTNGRKFWRLDDGDGEDLRSVVGER